VAQLASDVESKLYSVIMMGGGMVCQHNLSGWSACIVCICWLVVLYGMYADKCKSCNTCYTEMRPRQSQAEKACARSIRSWLHF